MLRAYKRTLKHKLQRISYRSTHGKANIVSRTGARTHGSTSCYRTHTATALFSIKTPSSCEIEDFAQAHICKLLVILRCACCGGMYAMNDIARDSP